MSEWSCIQREEGELKGLREGEEERERERERERDANPD